MEREAESSSPLPTDPVPPPQGHPYPETPLREPSSTESVYVGINNEGKCTLIYKNHKFRIVMAATFVAMVGGFFASAYGSDAIK